jgi:hypothetical protein
MDELDRFMDELDRFRDFRHGVAAPSAEAGRRASARLESALGGGRRRAKIRVYRAVALAVVAGATAAALLVSAPWSSSPGFLEKAQAALTPPAGTILHQKWELTSTSTDPACTVTRGPNEIWIDQTPPHRYRALLNDLPPHPLPPPRALACASPTPSELGGTFDTGETLRFVPPNTLTVNPLQFVFPLDPVKELREAISEGRAHDEGETQLDGRTVERIRIDAPPGCPVPGCSREPSYAYVDPDTFAPVQVESPHGYITTAGGPVVRLHMVWRTLTFEYLPRTPANLALADIRAQHPNATPYLWSR